MSSYGRYEGEENNQGNWRNGDEENDPDGRESEELPRRRGRAEEKGSPGE